MQALERRRDFLLDLLLGLVLTALGIAITLGDDGSRLDSATVAAVTLPVIWRRRAPLACCAALAAGVVVSGLPTFAQVRCGVAIPAALLVLFASGARSPAPAARGGLALVLAGMAFLSFTDPNISPAALTFVAPLCAGVWGAGRLVRSRTRLAAQLLERTRALENRRAQTARLAVEVERTRLAAELDAAARRRVQEIVALAVCDERALAADPDGARATFAQIERAGRASLNEMRGLLGALRSDEPLQRAPRPTLAQLDGLLEAARARGRAVGLGVEGARRSLPEGVELAAYRVVEHALAAGDGAASVRLRYQAEALELEVEGADGASAMLIAASERVAAHGGAFAVRALGPGRTVLWARLPVAAAAHG